MKKRTLIIIATSAVLLSLCGLMIFIGLMTARSIDIRPDRLFHVNTFWVEGDDSKSVKISGPLELEVHNTSGKVDIQAADDGEVIVEIHKRAGGITQQAAQENLESIQVDVSKTAGKVVVDATGGGALDIAIDEYIIDLTIKVPAESTIYVENKFGDTDLSDTKGDIEVESDFGSLTVANIDGSLKAVLKTGDINIRKVNGTSGAMDLYTDFGMVTLNSIQAASCQIKSNNGDIEIDDLDVDGELKADSSFGSIRLDQVNAENVIIDSNSGSLSLVGVTVKNLVDASTSNGDITLEDVKAVEYKIVSLSGRIEGNGLSGKIQVETDFGTLDFIGCHADMLELVSKNGNIEYQGSLGEGPHSTNTDFGDIRLVFPKDTSLSLDIKTEFGTFKTDFDLLVTGDLDGNHWTGKIGDGDATLEARTNNGNITINQE